MDNSATLIWITIFCSYVIALSITTYNRRLMHPYPRHYPGLILIINGTVIGFGIIIALMFYGFYNLRHLFISTLSHVGILVTISRAFYLLFALNINIDINRLDVNASDKKPTQSLTLPHDNPTKDDIIQLISLSEWNPGFYFRKRHWTHSRYLIILLILAISSTIITAQFASSSSRDLLIIDIIWLGFESIATYIIAKELSKLTQDRDAFQLKNELIIIGIIQFLLFVISISIKNSNSSLIPYAICLVGGSVIYVSIINLNPYRLSVRCQTEWHQQLSDLKCISRIDQVLIMPSAFDAYLRFSASEFTSENPLFWLSVYKFKQKFISSEFSVESTQHITNVLSELFIMAISIVNKYVIPNSDCQINIEATMCQSIISELKQQLSKIGLENKSEKKYMLDIPLHSIINDQLLQLPINDLHKINVSLYNLFNPAENVVIQLMQQNSFNRFRGSAQFASLLTHIN